MGNDLDRCFEIGKAVVADRYGEFDNEPIEWEITDGLLEENTNGYTDSRISTERRGNVVLIDDDARPQEMGIAKTLVDEHPKSACKVIGHELVEWRAAEQMPSTDVIASNTDYAAEFVEDGICRDINERAGEEICEPSWSSEYKA